MPNRQIVNGEPYRYGYQGEFAETDPETGKPMFQLRLYDPRINRWTTTDPYGQHASPYMSMGNSWPNRVDPDGGCDKPGSSCGWFKRLFYSQDSENQWDFWQEYGITSMDQVLEGIHDRGSLRQIAIESLETGNFAQSLRDMGMDVSVTNDRRKAMNSNINFMVGSALPTGKIATASNVKSIGGNNIVYSSVSKGVTQYVGITNNFARRAAQHLSSKGISIDPLMKGLSRADARSVEQALIEIHGLSKHGGSLLNKINSIAKTNSIYAESLQKGFDLLKTIGY
jgi:RHS repeat-associated protein